MKGNNTNVFVTLAVSAAFLGASFGLGDTPRAAAATEEPARELAPEQAGQTAAQFLDEAASESVQEGFNEVCSTVQEMIREAQGGQSQGGQFPAGVPYF